MGRFSGRLRPDLGNNAGTTTAGLGSKGLMSITGQVQTEHDSPFLRAALFTILSDTRHNRD